MLEPESPLSPSSHQLLVPPPKQKRSSVACRRCRRLRAKCVKDDDKGVCRGCIEASVPNECQFLPRGMSAIDRAPRPPQNRKRQARPKDTDQSAKPSESSQPYIAPICTTCAHPLSGNMALLPPQEELVEACEWFFSTYFQLGFLHKPTFMHKLQTAPQNLSTFLLLSMLAISARFTPTLIQRFGTPADAAGVFAKRAQTLVGEEMLGVPTLDRAQAFFLCSIWNWGSGYRDRSWIFLGVAARMASVLRLSQEESFGLRENTSVDKIIHAEVCRRTWWVIFMSDNLLSSGCGRPISFDLDKVTIPLPCEEDHFTFGYNGTATVLSGTRARPRLAPPARFPTSQIDPALSNGVTDTVPSAGDRSLYGNLVTIADIWARVARGALARGKPASGTKSPWRSDSEFVNMSRELQTWEATLTNRQTWSLSNLLGYQSKNLDLGYRCIFMIFHLSHIVLRRSYLPMMARDVHSSTTSGFTAEVPPPMYWENLVHEMFGHALKVIELVRSWVPTMPFSRGSTPMMGFAIYMSGSVLSYLKRWPWLCPALADLAGNAILDALDLLLELSIVWPTMAMRWHKGLSHSASMVPPHSDYIHRQVEGFGTTAEEDLDMDDKEGMYRHHKYGDETEAMDQDERAELPERSIRRREDDGSPIPQGADMLYSLATAASTHRSPNGMPISPDGPGPAGHPHSHPHAHPHPAPHNPYPVGASIAEGAPQTNWNKYQEELGTLFKDDYSSQMEYAGDGWAF